VRGECNAFGFVDEEVPFAPNVKWLRCSLPPNHPEVLHQGIIPGTDLWAAWGDD